MEREMVRKKEERLDKKSNDHSINEDEWFHALMEKSSDVVLVLDHELKLSYASPSFHDLFGKEPSEFQESRIDVLLSDYIHPDNLETTLTTFEKCLEEPEKECQVEFKFKHADGTWHYLVATGKNYREIPSANGLVVNVKDITDQKLAEDMITLKNQMLTSIADYTQAIAFTHPDQLYATIVTKLKEITGAAEVLINDYDDGKSELVLRQSTLSDDGNTKIMKIIGSKLNGFKSPVSKDMYQEITTSTIGRVKSLHEASFGAISKPVGKMIEKMFGFSWFVGLALTRNEQLVGTILIAGKKGAAEPGDEELLAYASATANVLARRKAEVDLAQNEERFRSLIEKSSDVILVISRDSKVSYVSQSFSKTFGMEPTELLQTSLVEFMTEHVHPDDLGKMMQEFQECLAMPGAESRMEFRLKNADGTWRHLVAIGKNHFETPSVEGLVANIRDITEQKKAGEALRESEERLKVAQSVGRMGDWEFDLATNKVTWSDETYILYERDKSLGPPTPEEEAKYYLPEHAVMTREFAKRAIENGEEFAYDLTAKLPSGRTAFFYATIHSKRDENGRIAKLFGTVQDITDHKRTETAIIESEQKFRQLAENIDFVFWLTDWVEKKLLYVNNAYEKVFGMTVESAYADRTGWKKAIHPDDLKRAETEFQSHAAKGESLEMEYRILCDGNIKWIHERALPLKDEKGEVVRFINVAEDITERKKAEEIINDATFLLNDVGEMAHIGGWELDLRTKAVHWTKETYIIHDISEDQKFDLSKAVLFYDLPTRSTLESAMQRCMESGESFDLELPFTSAKGRHIWVRAIGHAVKVDGTVAKLMGINQDITDSKKVKEELLQSNERFSKAFHSSPILKTISEVESGTIIDVNDTMARTYGLPREEIIGRTSSELGTWLDPKMRDKLLNLIRKYGRINGIDLQIRTQTGEVRDLLWSGDLVHISGKQCLLESALDITERELVSKALRESDLKYRLLVDTANEAILVAQNGLLKFVNRMAVKLLEDYTEQEILTLPFSEFIHPDDREIVAGNYRRRIKGEEVPKKYTFRTITRAGAVKWVEISSVKLDWEGSPATLNLISDITERKQMEMELNDYSENLQNMVKETTKELEETHARMIKQERLAILGQMAASLSHELRNPLSVINNVAYYLRTKFPDVDEKTLKMLDLLEKEVDRSDRIIGNMLSFSRQKPNVHKDTDLNDLVHSFFSTSDATPGDITVKLELSDAVPKISADSEKLRQVLDNLVSNACQAMPDGGLLTVSTRAGDREMVELSVKDTGHGMSDEIQSQIFEPLFSTRTTGFGLGLVIVKTLVADHGGEIKVKSKEGEGSEFIITLPIAGRSS